MNNKEKARELSKKFARQYHANNWPEWSDDEALHYSNEEINNACLEMAQWKDEQTKQLLIDKTKFLSTSAAQDSIRRCTIEEIYRELFNEEMPNSNPYIK